MLEARELLKSGKIPIPERLKKLAVGKARGHKRGMALSALRTQAVVNYLKSGTGDAPDSTQLAKFAELADKGFLESQDVCVCVCA